MPPFTGVAVKLTCVPLQIVLLIADEVIVTDAGKLELTVIVSEFDAAGEPVAQVALEIIIQLMISPLCSEEVEKLLLSAPELLPFTSHW